MVKKAGLVERVNKLRQAVELSQGRADAGVLSQATEVLGNVDSRLAIAGDATVVAIAGATGSGKSSLFNAVSGTQLAKPGIKRPTTSRAFAATFGSERTADMDALLNWLAIPDRGTAPAADQLAGLVLLDLPDHDSTEVAHRMEVDRLVKVVDMFVWVTDPQKYADAALHDNYLRPLAAHAGTMIVVLNQVDRLNDAEQTHIVADLRRLLNSEGLGGAALLPVSATTGIGVEALREKLGQALKQKKAASSRLSTDVGLIADKLRAENGTGEVPSISKKSVQRLAVDMAAAAGAETVTEAVLTSWRHRGVLATGWPLVSWLAALRPDPLRRLHLDKLPVVRRKQLEPTAQQRTSLPVMASVSRARIDAGVRTIIDEATPSLSRGWAKAVADAARADDKHLPDALDGAIARADLGMDSGNGWWSVVKVIHWMLIITVLVNLGWLGLNFVLAYFGFPPLMMPRWHRLPVPTWLVMGAVAAGILLALLSRIFVEWGARYKANRANKAVRNSVARACLDHVITPVDAELTRLAQARELLTGV